MGSLKETMMTKDNPFATFSDGMTEMQKNAVGWMTAAGVTKYPGAANLAAQPMAAIAASSAIGMGMASQMFGMMAGAMAGAMKATNMLASESTGGLSTPFGAANPFNFDWAIGSFDDTSETAPTEKKAKTPDAAPKPAPKPVPVAKIVSSDSASVKKATTAEPVGDPVAKTKAPEAPAKTKTPEPPAKPQAAESAAEPVMPEDFKKPASMKKPDQPDDLKKISGIGPKLETVLNGLGVWTFGQIAAWTPNEIAWVDDYLQFKGRIERDNWIPQAGELAGKGK
ncbi:NADH-ubiquinone dehydrogenase [Oricola cellulosilytica]|uniref:NADH-ubiquinone dehydrogenase n=1 Tax=Oricola cellulosilytica TaxID=1429082 RepID=A0A4R0PG38_9HYPH|nr:NADH-ubiquinone dehydrogenase [Oricola cellulosilytica]TCD14444.1 NADH-ubiquinone dehydrogenase [Oricola cellulosilytica]